MLHERYRKDYAGEFVVTETVYSNGKISQKRDWVPNNLENEFISSRAVVIGSDLERQKLNHTLLAKHRGGLLGKQRLQTYGSGELWRQMRFDFYVTSDRQQTRDLVNADYDKNSAVYASASMILEHPGRFYLVPYQPVLDPAATSLYLAAFDGHKEIFMIGFLASFEGQTTRWADDMQIVMETYPSTEFIAVSHGAPPKNWTNVLNFRQMPIRDFVVYCDV